MTDDWRIEIRNRLAASTMTPDDARAIVKLKNKNIPGKLFKYRVFSEYSLANLRNKTLYCSHADEFNDPYECAIQLTVARPPAMESLLDEAKHTLDSISFERLMRRTTLLTEAQSEAVGRSFAEKIKSVIKICSLSERIDSMLMWSHYTGNHTGFAMEYDFRNLINTDKIPNFLWPVIYENSIPDASELMSALLQDNPTDPFNNVFGISAAIRKALDWQYEQEWRLVLFHETALNIQAPLKAIYLGTRIADQHKNSLINEANALEIPVYQMKLAHRTFEMSYSQI